jgi:hypothetical protein
MKNSILTSIIFLFITCSIFSQTTPKDTITEVKDSIEKADGTKISYAEFTRICNESFKFAYSQLSEEDINLFKGVSISVGIIEDKKDKPE